MTYTYEGKNRKGDHICYISNLSKIRAHYPAWSITKSLPMIIEETYTSWQSRQLPTLGLLKS